MKQAACAADPIADNRQRSNYAGHRDPVRHGRSLVPPWPDRIALRDGSWMRQPHAHAPCVNPPAGGRETLAPADRSRTQSALWPHQELLPGGLTRVTPQRLQVQRLAK